jgi:cytochrome c-type biogenesis protein
MLDEFFFTVNSWMAGGAFLAVVGCIVWGMVSVVFSPCHMAAIPLIMSYVAGQNMALKARHASFYAVAFTFGLSITIGLVGLGCTLLGRMLGEIGPYWSLLVGAVLIWVALDTLGVTKCSMTSCFLRRIKIRGLPGAFALGLFYGVVSGSCTFGFIAPIVAMITIQHKVVTGMFFISLFTLGYCIPIAIAGSSTAIVKRLLESRSFHEGGSWFRKCSGTAIAIMGGYFILRPFL